MSFRILGLEPTQFQPLFLLTDAALHDLGARRMVADNLRMPCRVSMDHAQLGEEVLLLNYAHQTANTPYRATHAIFVRKCATEQFECVNQIPEILATRKLSIRAFDAEHMMIDADVCEGLQVAEIFERFFDQSNTSYLQVHNAIRGCYAARVERA